MDKLPLEILTVILGHLDLNDLARCGQVSRHLRDVVNEVLSTITCICHKTDSSDDPTHLPNQLSDAIRRMSKNTSYQVCFNDKNIRSFLQFVSKKCPRVSSFIATNQCILIEDISPLADRIAFLLGNLITERSNRVDRNTIDAKTLAANFPNLRFYHSFLTPGICPNTVAREYSLLPSNQLAKYDEYCHERHDCSMWGVDVRSMDNLFSTSVNSSLALCELRPSSLNSLQFLQLSKPPSDKGHLPHLPNLLRANLECEENVNNMIYLLRNSPRLEAVFLEGEINKQSIPALNLLFSNCRALQVFELTCYTDGDGLVDDPDQYLDLSQSIRLKRITMKQCWYDFGTSEMAIPVVLPPHSLCHTIVCYQDTIQFEMDGRKYWLDDRVVSFNRMGAFAQPIELKIETTKTDKVDKVLTLCPMVSRLTFNSAGFCDYDSFEYFVPIFRSVLAKSDVSDIRVGYITHEICETAAKKFFAEINKYPNRSFIVTIERAASRDTVELIFAILSRNYTMSSEDSLCGGLNVCVNIPAVNVSSTLNAKQRSVVF